MRVYDTINFIDIIIIILVGTVSLGARQLSPTNSFKFSNSSLFFSRESFRFMFTIFQQLLLQDFTMGVIWGNILLYFYGSIQTWSYHHQSLLSVFTSWSWQMNSTPDSSEVVIVGLMDGYFFSRLMRWWEASWTWGRGTAAAPHTSTLGWSPGCGWSRRGRAGPRSCLPFPSHRHDFWVRISQHRHSFC